MWAPVAAAAVGAVGSLVSGVGQYSAAQSQARSDDQNANLALQQGRSEAAAVREKARRLAGQNRAAIGASGVDVSGFADALTDSDINAELDAQTAEWNRDVEAANYRSRAKQARKAGVGALIGGAIGAGTQALAGYGNWRVLNASSAAPAAAGPGMARFGGVF